MLERRLQRGVHVTFIGLAINVLLSACKMTAGILGHSQALVADAIESMADIISSVVVWRGLVVAAAPADAEHPYGHGKAEPLAAGIVAAFLLFAAAGIALKSLGEVLAPHESPRPFTLLVLLGVVIVKEGLFRYVLQQAHSVESSAVRNDAWHHRSDAITSFAAAIGISIALIGGPDYAAADDCAAIAAAGIIAWNGTRLLRRTLPELMDTSPGAEVTEEIKQLARDVAGVQAVEKCIVRQAGYQYFVEMHVEVDPEMSVAQAHLIAHQVKDKIRATLSKVQDVLVHIEPSKRMDLKNGPSVASRELR